MIKVGIIGASGYIGRELVRLLSKHPEVEDIEVTSRQFAGKKFSSIFKNFSKVFEKRFLKEFSGNEDLDAVFVSAPLEECLDLISSFIERDIRVISLGGKFRIKDKALDEKLYKSKSELSEERIDQLRGIATYGLSEFYREKIKKAKLVANPGCYPTSILLGILPLSKLFEVKKITINVVSISGTSGAGAKPSQHLHHPEMSGNLKPYNIVFHRHIPEMESISREFGLELDISFTPAVGDFARGIYSFIKVNSSDVPENLAESYEKFYSAEKFVRVVEKNEKNERIPNLKDVIFTNYCDLGLNVVQEGKILILSVLDNLGKGGASQAVQNMNIMFNFKEECGIDSIAGNP